MDRVSPGPATVTPTYIGHVSFFNASVSLVSVPAKGELVHNCKYFLTATRKVEGSQRSFASAHAAGIILPEVTIETLSFRLVTLQNAWITRIMKAGHRNPHYPGSRKVDPGYEAIMWQATEPILADGVRQYASYDWNALNHLFLPKGRGA